MPYRFDRRSCVELATATLAVGSVQRPSADKWRERWKSDLKPSVVTTSRRLTSPGREWPVGKTTDDVQHGRCISRLC
jgi:hypothetical protein